MADDPEFVLPDGAHAISEIEGNGKPVIIGYVTSTYFSPTLKRSIALGLIEGGLDRKDEIIDFSVDDKRVVKARIVEPVFYDPEGSKQFA